MWLLVPVAVFFILSIMFAIRLGKEMADLDIKEASPNIVSIVGLILYVKEKRKRKEPLSFNFWAALCCVIMIFAPFICIPFM